MAAKSNLEIVVTAKNLASAGLSAASGDVERFDGAMQGLDRNIQRASTVAMGALTGIGVASLKAGIDFESSFAGIRKTVNGTEEDFEMLAAGMRNMSKEIPVNVNELNRIGEAAGQLGIKTENILDFTETMAQLGVATNLSSEEAATSLARLSNITGMSQTDFDNLGSSVVALGNNFATTEAEIVEMGLRLAGAGSTIGMSEAQILGFATALTSVGINAEAGGTAFSKLMIGISSEVETGGNKLETFARIAGMAADDFVEKWQTDPAEALTAFVRGLGDVEGQSQSTLSMLEELGVTEARMRDALLRSAGAADMMTEAMSLSNEAWVENTALTKEAETRFETTASQLQLLRNEANDAAITIGQQMAPHLRTVVGLASEGFEAFGKLDESTQGAVLAAGALTAVMGKLGPAMGMSSLKAVGLGAGLGAAFVAADMLVNSIKGYGLVALIDGTGEAAERAAEFTDTFADALMRLGGDDVMGAAETALRGVSEAVREIGDWDIRGSGIYNLPEATEAFEEFGEGVALATEKMREAEVPAAQITAFIGEQRVKAQELAEATGFSAEQQGILNAAWESGLDSLGNMPQLYRDTTEQMADLSGKSSDAVFSVRDLAAATEAAETKLRAVPPAAEPASTAVDTFRSMAFDAKKETYDFATAIDTLAASFSEANPDYQEIVFQQSRLNEELADIVRLGDAASDDQKERARVIEEELLPALEDERLAYDENKTAIDGFKGHMTNLMGEAGYGGLLTAMQEVDRAHESQITVLGNVSDIYGLLADDSVPDAITALGSLKDALKPEEWAVLAEAIGPALIQAITNGINNPAERARAIVAAHSLGFDVSKGVADGMTGTLAMGALLGASNGIVDFVISAARQRARSQSPSMEAHDKIGIPLAEGVGTGLVEGTRTIVVPLVEEMVDEVIAAGEERARLSLQGLTGVSAGWTGYIDPLDPNRPRVSDMTPDEVSAYYRSLRNTNSRDRTHIGQYSTPSGMVDVFENAWGQTGYFDANGAFRHHDFGMGPGAKGTTIIVNANAVGMTSSDLVHAVEEEASLVY